MADSKAIPSGGSRFRSKQLDMIKALAIFFVVAFHFFPGSFGWHMRVMPAGWFEGFWSQPHPDLLLFLESYLYLGVNMFVIASGFGLYLSHLKAAKPMDLKEFFVKRILRLMPAAILSIVILFFVKGFFLGEWVITNWYYNLFPFLGGLNLFSDRWFFPPVNGETWFLGLIVQLYLFFPLLVWMYEKLGEKRFLLILFLTAVIFRGVYYAFWKDTISSLSYGLSVGRLFEFGFGMALAKRFVDGKKLSLLWIPGIFCALGYFWAWSFPFADALAGVGLFSLAWTAFTQVPEHPLFAQIALQSYLIFLLHHPFLWILTKLGFHNEWSLFGFLVFVLFFIFSYWLAKISQWLLDHSAMLFRRIPS